MTTFKHPIIGQEAIVSTYGVGRVVGYVDRFPKQSISVRTYADNISRDYDPANVELIDPRRPTV